MTGYAMEDSGRASIKRICAKRSAFIPCAVRKRWRPGSADDCGTLAGAVEQSRRGCAVIVDAIIFNWLIAGTDAHARTTVCCWAAWRSTTCALLRSGKHSAVPTMTFKAKLAMKIGGEYRLRYIGLRIGEIRSRMRWTRVCSWIVSGQ